MASSPIRSALSRVFAALMVALATHGVHAGTAMDGMVRVGDFLIGKYEVTIDEYRAFLNAVASNEDRYSLYDPMMGSDLNIAGITTSTSAGIISYNAFGTKTRPITYVSWFDAARYVNWITNGKTNGGTETGAYTLLNEITTGSAPVRNPGATFFIPAVDEWTKAAYGSATVSPRIYPTQSDSPPGNKQGSLPNQANYGYGGFSRTQSPQYDPNQNYLTEVGAFSGSESFYGTYDQAGNVAEWTDGPGENLQVLGGSWLDTQPSSLTREGGFTANPGDSGPEFGFRIAGVYTAVPPDEIVIPVPAGESWKQSVSPTFKKPNLDRSVPVRKTEPGAFVVDEKNEHDNTFTVEGGVLRLEHSLALKKSQLVIVAGGTGQVAPATATSVASLDLASGNGLMDVTTGTLTISSGMTIPKLVIELLKGRGNGLWTGTSGITSTTVAAQAASGTPRELGWIENIDGSLTVAYAAPGDANLDGQVDILDLDTILAGGKFDLIEANPSATWQDGDFNYDSTVDVLDVVAMMATATYDQGIYAPALSSSVAAVPEPSTLSVAGAGAAALSFLARRQRRVC